MIGYGARSATTYAWALALPVFIAFTAQPAQATATLNCEIADKNATLSLQAAVGHGAGEVISSLSGTIDIALKGVPDDLRKIALQDTHLTQRWLYGRDLRLRLYGERGEGKPHGSIDLVLVTRRAGKDEESPYTGTYELTVYFLPNESAAEGKTLKARGKAECTAG